MEARIVVPTEVVLLDFDDALTVRSVEEVAEVRAAGSTEWQEMAVAREFERGPGTVRVHLGTTAQPNQLLRLRTVERFFVKAVLPIAYPALAFDEAGNGIIGATSSSLVWA